MNVVVVETQFLGISRIDVNTNNYRRWKETTTERIGIKRTAKTKTYVIAVSDPLTTTATATMTTAAKVKTLAVKKTKMIPVIKISSSMIISKPSVISNSQWCGDEVVLIWFDLLICCVILDEDDDEEIDRLTCWVCERAFRYLSPLFVLFSQFGLMTFWNNDRHLLSIRSSTRILERHKIRERHFGWVNFVSLNYLIFSIRLAWFSGKTRQHTLCIHHTPDHTFSACFLFCPVFFLFFVFFFFVLCHGKIDDGIAEWRH